MSTRSIFPSTTTSKGSTAMEDLLHCFCIDWLLSTCLGIRLRVEQCDEGGWDRGGRHHLAVGVVGAEVPVPGEKSHQMPLYVSIKSCTNVIVVQL